MMTSFGIQKYGSNQLRKKLNHLPELDYHPGRLQEPIIKGRSYKARNTRKASPPKASKKLSTKGQIKKSQYSLEQSRDL